MNNRIQSFWYGNTISTIEKLSIASFLKNGHEVDIYCYNPIQNLPSGVNLKDANRIIPKEKVFLDSSGGIASFSDWFRYKMLYEVGGWWVDLDIICLRPFAIPNDYCFASENFSTNFEIGITCCVIKSPPKAEFLKDILDYIESFENYRDIQWGEFGPALINYVLKQYDSSEFVMPVHAFCPVDWTDMKRIVNDVYLTIPIDSYSIHMWNNLWRINKVDKEKVYPPGTVYEMLKLKYLESIP